MAASNLLDLVDRIKSGEVNADGGGEFNVGLGFARIGKDDSVRGDSKG